MFVAGIDLGSVAAKFVIIDSQRKILSYMVTDTIPDIENLGEGLYQASLEKAGLQKEDISYVVSTGYGRYSVSFANENLTEIICHATGVHHLLPSVRTIIDIGGQDSKAMVLDETGRIKNFAMNTRCAAGTGRFTEVMARALKIELEKWGEIITSANSRARISNICTVFAESEVISKIMQKVPLNSILAGVCEAIVARILETVQRAGGVVPEVAFTGGVANNLGVKQVLEEKLGTKVIVPDIPQRTGALGAALLALKLKQIADAGK